MEVLTVNKQHAQIMVDRMVQDGYTVLKMDTIYHPRYGAMADRWYIQAVDPNGYVDYWHYPAQYPTHIEIKHTHDYALTGQCSVCGIINSDLVDQHDHYWRTYSVVDVFAAQCITNTTKLVDAINECSRLASERRITVDVRLGHKTLVRITG
jgi:hypothetical protein